MDTSMAYKTWEMSNSIETVSSVDEIFKYDRQQQQEILQAKPWQKDPHYFKNIKISALALLKMVGNCNLLIVWHDIPANSTYTMQQANVWRISS